MEKLYICIMEGIKDYEDYLSLFNDDLVVICRKILKRTEDCELYDFDGSPEHCDMIEFFNKFGLHKLLTPEKVEKWKH